MNTVQSMEITNIKKKKLKLWFMMKKLQEFDGKQFEYDLMYWYVFV